MMAFSFLFQFFHISLALSRIARKLRLKSQSHGNENQGNRRLVVSLPPLRPSELLRKIIVEKDETFCKMFEVTPPTEQE